MRAGEPQQRIGGEQEQEGGEDGEGDDNDDDEDEDHATDEEREGEVGRAEGGAGQQEAEEPLVGGSTSCPRQAC